MKPTSEYVIHVTDGKIDGQVTVPEYLKMHNLGSKTPGYIAYGVVILFVVVVIARSKLVSNLIENFKGK